MSTVYVDDLYLPWGRGVWCHLWSEDEQELHRFAQSIGLRRSWFQNKNLDFKHYDVTKTKRAMAVDAGAVEVTAQRMVELKNEARDGKRIELRYNPNSSKPDEVKVKRYRFPEGIVICNGDTINFSLGIDGEVVSIVVRADGSSETYQMIKENEEQSDE